ncbi:hypothetical protein HanPSC8_Chr17g0766221 [Helianthus annuus]|nr:hypothetical protein HanPSC8_Chr17g0766221 [Helianthus annuus]
MVVRYHGYGTCHLGTLEWSWVELFWSTHDIHWFLYFWFLKHWMIIYLLLPLNMLNLDYVMNALP